MKEIARLTIPAESSKIQSLSWCGNELVDFASGIIRYRLDGTHDKRRWGGFGRNRCISSPDGEYGIAYDMLGTKGLVFKGDSLIREINRSYYCADVYEYPVVLFTGKSGRTLLAHCPEEYCRLEIEDAETGERLTKRTSKSVDFFHSRLQVSPDGKFLLSAGWVWHPIDVAVCFDIERALLNPESLDENLMENPFWKTMDIPDMGDDLYEINSAAFNGVSQIVWISGNGDQDLKQALGVYDLAKRQNLSWIRLQEIAGTIMPIGDYVVDFYQHPKLVEVKSGEIICRWSDISSGTQIGSIIHHIPLPPHIAMDPANKRFAVANEDGITVIQLG